eukprot:712667-Lingulodinium_polyedra.AAC.1
MGAFLNAYLSSSRDNCSTTRNSRDNCSTTRSDMQSVGAVPHISQSTRSTHRPPYGEFSSIGVANAA